METYVTSLHANATVSHIGNEHRTVCGVTLTTAFHVTDQPTLPICTGCAARVGGPARQVARVLSAQQRRDDAVVALLIDGHTDQAIRRRLRVGTRSLVRWIADAMRRAGARTRFEWGYRVGRGTHVAPTSGDGWEQLTLF